MTTAIITREAALELCLQRVRDNIPAFNGQFPFIGEGDSLILGENDHWMTSFWTGEIWLAYAITGDDFYRHAAEAHLDSFRQRLADNVHINHDLGFLFLLTARAQYMLTANEDARTLALEAADRLLERYNSNGEYIQAWHEIGHPTEHGRFIVDCMMNIPLFYWASEQTGDPRYAEAANGHARTTRRYIIRPDGSTCHSFFMNPETGEPVGPSTVQGYADDSLWSRGQAWAIAGFAMAAEWSGDADFLAASQETADRFLAEITPDYVPLWDFRLPADEPQTLDTSAAAIAACGLMRLADLLEGEDAKRYRVAANRLIDAQLAAAFDPAETGVQGLLQNGSYHANKPEWAERYTLFGDYFFMEALTWLTGHDVDFWGR